MIVLRRLAPLLVPLLWLGPGCPCPGPLCTADTGADSGVDTAFGRLSYVADAQTTEVNGTRSFLSGHFGYVVTTPDGAERLCAVIYGFEDDGVPAMGGCPGCEWAFHLTLDHGVATGQGCSHVTGMEDGALDGVSLSWGFAPTYESGYASMDTVLFYGSPAYGWYPMFYNLPGQTDNVGNADDAGFQRVAGYVYYYL